jgi:hypothetical protein
MTDIAPLLGVLAAAIGAADMIPYVCDTLRGTTRPHRGTWLIWGALARLVLPSRLRLSQCAESRTAGVDGHRGLLPRAPVRFR